MFLRAEVLRKRKILILTLIFVLFLFSYGSSFAEIKIFFSPNGGIAKKIIKQIDNAQEPIIKTIVRAEKRGVNK